MANLAELTMISPGAWLVTCRSEHEVVDPYWSLEPMPSSPTTEHDAAGVTHKTCWSVEDLQIDPNGWKERGLSIAGQSSQNSNHG